MGNHSMIDLDDFFEDYGIIIPRNATIQQLRELKLLMENFKQNSVEQDNLLEEAKRIISQP